MNTNNLNRWGGTCAILLGITYVVIGIAFLMDPAATAVSSDQFYTFIASEPFWHIVFLVAFAVSGLLGLAVVYPITNAVTPPRYGWMRAIGIFAVVGFAATVIDYIWLLIDHPARAVVYVQAAPAAKLQIISEGLIGIDRLGWMGFGCLGLWVLAISLLGLWAKWPKLLSGLGIVAAIFYWIVLDGNISDISSLVSFAAAVGGIILAPIWYTWVGLRLRRASYTGTPAADRTAPSMTLTQGS